MSDLAKRLVIAVVLFFLVAFAINQILKNQAMAAENERLTEVNDAIRDTLQTHIDSLAVLDTVLVGAIAHADSLSQRVGPIRWRTRTIRLAGRVDTIQIATVDLDTITVEIPVAVAEELLACRILTQDCETFREVTDSTLRWYRTSTDSLQGQIDLLSKRFDVPHFGFFGLSLPLPNLSIGYGLLYSVGSDCSSSETIVEGDLEFQISTSCNNIHHGPVASLSWPIKIW